MQLLLAVIIVVVISVLIQKARIGNSEGKGVEAGGQESYSDDTLHAKEGTFDESQFFSPKTGKFKFPKYRSPRGALVKIVDVTDYREDIWIDLEPEDKRNFSIEDFEHFCGDAEIEVEQFNETILKPSHPVLKEIPCLKGKGEELEDLMLVIEDVPPKSEVVLWGADFEMKLFKEGYLQEHQFESPEALVEEQKNFIQRHKVSELKDLCKSIGESTNGKKQELVERLITRIDDIQTPVFLKPTTALFELIDRCRDAYVDDVRNTIDDWHPTVIKSVWDCAEIESFDSGVKKRVKVILAGHYWTDRCV